MRLLPVLKPADWDGPSKGARAHLWIGTKEDPEVYVAYAWEHDDELTYVTWDSHAGVEGDAIVRHAFANLDAYDGSYELVELNGSRLLVAAGRPFAAERVLSERFMQQVHDKLDSDEVVVSLPQRGSMLACARHCNEKVKHTMLELHRERWLAAEGGDRITSRLVVFRETMKTDTLVVGADGSVEGWD